jgi:hypothetical protein
MKPAQIILLAVYAVAAGLVALSGVVYPEAKQWSYWAAAVCALHYLVSLLLGSVKIATAARLASWCCQGISTLVCVDFLLLYFRTQEGGWLLAVAATAGLNFITTLVLSLALVPDSAPWAGKGSYDATSGKR